MKIDVLCSDPAHPVMPCLAEWVEMAGDVHDVKIYERIQECNGGDLLFLISCQEIIRADDRNRYTSVLVIHASDLPEGRGWSPLIWQVLEGRREIVLTLFEAGDKVDDGDVWKKQSIFIEPHELVAEINGKLFRAEIDLMDFAVEHFDSIQAEPQSGEGTIYYRKRTPEDSRLNPDLSLREQFDLIRISDPERYPAFLDLHGHRYKIRIEKVDDLSESNS